MIELIIIYILTIVLSFIGDMSNAFMIFKDIASAGYKMDIKKMNEITKQMEISSGKNSNLRLFIPIYNLYKVLVSRYKYVQQRQFILSELNIYDVLEEMTESEKEEFKKNPTGFNAMWIMAKSHLNEEKSNQEKVTLTGFQNDWILYSKDEKTGEIIILKAEGKFSDMSMEEQKEYILKENSPQTKENNEKKEKDESKIEVSLSDTTKTREEKIKELEELKQQLLSQVDEEKLSLFMDSFQKLNENSFQKTKKKKK